MKVFPRTSNGKIDRNASVFQTIELGKNPSDDIENLTPAEKKIREIWCTTLKTQDISVSDNFFEIGGNSLLAISVFSKIESEFNLDLGLRMFFDSPRIKDLGELIDIAILRNESKKHQRKDKIFSKIVKGQV